MEARVGIESPAQGIVGTGLESTDFPCLPHQPTPVANSQAARSAGAGLGSTAGLIVLSIFFPAFWLATSRSCWVCRFSQSCALVPKYRASRRAISAVTDLRRRTISLTVGADTPRSF